MSPANLPSQLVLLLLLFGFVVIVFIPFLFLLLISNSLFFMHSFYGKIFVKIKAHRTSAEHSQTFPDAE